MKLPIYMDYHATTPVDREVLDEMMPYFQEEFGNASSSTHEKGWVAEEAIETARGRVASLIGAKSGEIFFTSGATESNNWCLKGVFEAYADKGNHIITTCTEHKAVLDTCTYLESKGAHVTYLSVDEHGIVDPEELYQHISGQTILVSIMAANNEIGTLNNIRRLAEICREKDVLFHSDVVQAVGLVDICVNRMPVDFLSMSGHKIYGPKGIGALFVRQKDPAIKIPPLLHGGGQEKGLRAGTLNVPAAVGFGKAAEITARVKASESQKLRDLRDRLWMGLKAKIPDVRLNGHPTNRLANNLNVSFPGVSSTRLIYAMNDILVSSGSACNSAKSKGSHVLDCIGATEDEANSNVRLSLGRYTTREEVDYAVKEIVEKVKKFRPKEPSQAS